MADDVVCITVNNGEKMPLLGYSLPSQSSDVLTDPLEKAIHVGFRHIVVDFSNDLDLQIGHVLQRHLAEGHIDREELFITVKMSLQDVERGKIKSRFLQRLYTLGLNHVDLVVLDIPKTTSQNGKKNIRPTRDTQEKAGDAVSRLWQGAMSIKEEGYTRSLGLYCSDHVTLLNVLQRPSVAPQIIMTNSSSPLVVKYGRNLAKFCEGRNICVVVEIADNHNLTNGHSEHGDSGSRAGTDKLLCQISYQMQRGLDQVIARSYVERGFAVTTSTVNHTVIQQSFEVFDFSLHSQDMEALMSCER